MPGPLSIFMATVGILGALNTARGSIQTIHDDVKSWKRAKRAIDDLSAKLNEQYELMEEWKENWMVWEDDEVFWQYLWGSNWGSIRGTLNQISERSKELEQGLGPLTRSSTRTSTKLKFVGYQKKYLQDCMEELHRITSELPATTRRFFRDVHRRKDTPDVREIQEIGNLHQLVRLSIKTRELSQAFHKACNSDRKDMVLDLELNFFGTDLPKERSKAISKFAAMDKLDFQVLAKANEESEIVVKTVVQHDTTLEITDCKRTFSEALQEVIDRRTDSAFDTPGDGPRYRVKELLENTTFDTKCYRQHILAGALTDNDDLRLTARIKLALDLVEAGLLFLKTSWFAGLCSCCVRLKQPSRATLLRTGMIQHIRPYYANIQPERCWCDHPRPPSPVVNNPETNMISEHICLLGVLLTEIATCSPVFDVQRSVQDDGIVLVRLKVLSGAAHAPHFEDLESSLERIRQATSNKYSEAVEYCLKSTKTPDQVEQIDIEDYYWKVLLPIQGYYESLTNRPRLPQIF